MEWSSMQSSRRRRITGHAAAATLAAIGIVHAGWALGGRWPGATDAELAGWVLSRAERQAMLRRTGRELPPVPLTWAVALGLLGAAGVVAAAAADHGPPGVRRGAGTVAAALLARGAAGIADSARAGLDEPYRRLDLAVYNPLCLALAAAIAHTLRRRADRS